MQGQHFVRVLVPLRLDWIPVYRTESQLRRGQIVDVPFSGHLYTGTVWEVDAAPDVPDEQILHIASADSGIPDRDGRELEFWKFLSAYYLCSPCEVYRAALPAIKSEQAEIRRRRKAEAMAASRQEAETRRMLDRLTAAAGRIELRLEAVGTKLAASHRSQAVVSRLEEQKAALERQLAEKRSAISGLSPKRNAPPSEAPGGNARESTPPRRKARPQVIIGAGRSSRYLEAVREALSAGGQVLILCPEEAFRRRLQETFAPALGHQLHIAGTGVSSGQRGRTALALQRGESLAVASTKTGIFLPFSKLSLVIIDEEQDALFKQNDSAPRYNGRDAAIKLAELHSADVILGSPCPSLETMHNCLTGKFDMLSDGGSPARPVIVDTDEEKKKNGMSGYFSRRLAAAIRKCPGSVMLIRGWEKPDELGEEIALMFPDKEIKVATVAELKRNGSSAASMIAVLQADALVSRDDFRSDERALQLVAVLCGMAPEVWIQTSVRERFDGSRTAAMLMDERKKFNFPPYTRIVDIRRARTGEIVSRHFLARDRSLASRKAEILASMPQDCYPDVDPA